MRMIRWLHFGGRWKCGSSQHFATQSRRPELVKEMEMLLEEGLEWNALGLRLLANRMVDEGQKHSCKRNKN